MDLFFLYFQPVHFADADFMEELMLRLCFTL